ncbi:MAG: nicotinate-nucleotide adenylyltransferase [Schwartzia sp.]|nr:nicotinate-nucleotide adenylyltransferase [Schwartzia sp. (in: firmicutes)]
MGDTLKKAGILGGTFDPVHVGHLMMAEAVRDEYHLDKIIFIPSGNPPHKREQKVADARHRYMMTVLATCSNPYFEVSDIEVKREGLSYSVDTVRALQKLHGGTKFYFLIGTDIVKTIATWERIEELLSICEFIAAQRPGSDASAESLRRELGEIGEARIHPLATPELEISSTDIRARVRRGSSIKYIVPEAVEQYIVKNGLYLQ